SSDLELEGPRVLQALGLEHQAGAGGGVERIGAQQRGHADVGCDPRGRVQHVVELWQRRVGRHARSLADPAPAVFSKPNAAGEGLSTDSKRRPDAGLQLTWG